MSTCGIVTTCFCVAGCLLGALCHAGTLSEDAILYSSPDQTIGELRAGTSITVQEQRGAWCKVRYDTPHGFITGYIKASAIDGVTDESLQARSSSLQRGPDSQSQAESPRNPYWGNHRSHFARRLGPQDPTFSAQIGRSSAVTVCVDISPSMVAKKAKEMALEDAVQILDALPEGATFNLIVFVDGADSFAPSMTRSTQANLEKARDWLSQDFDHRRQGQLRGYAGSTPLEAMKLATSMGSDAVFVLSDDLPYLSKGSRSNDEEVKGHVDQILAWAESLRVGATSPPRIHTRAYNPHNNQRGKDGVAYMKELSRITGGCFTQVDE